MSDAAMRRRRRGCWECAHRRLPPDSDQCTACLDDDAAPGFVAALEQLQPPPDEAPISAQGPSAAVTPAESDPVERPSHYTRGTVECIDAIEAAVTGLEGVEAVLTGQALKYLWRWRHKGNPIEDLRKARWYLDRLLARAGGGAK